MARTPKWSKAAKPARKKPAPKRARTVATSKQKTARPKRGAVPPRRAVSTTNGFTEKSVSVDGFRIRYAEAGKGDVVVAIHGGGGMRISAAHELLARKYRVIAFEIPGFGTSPANERSSSLRELAQTMTQALGKLDVTRYSLMGNSFGAKLAAWMAVEAPDKLKTLIMVAPATIRLERQIPVARTPEERIALFHAHPARQPKPAPLDAAIDAKQTALIRRLIGPTRDGELESKLKELKVPSLALFGTQDRITPTGAARFYREVIPDCHIVMVYDAAHAIDADRPEAVAEVVQDFIERQDKFLVTGQSGVIHP